MFHEFIWIKIHATHQWSVGGIQCVWWIFSSPICIKAEENAILEVESEKGGYTLTMDSSLTIFRKFSQSVESPLQSHLVTDNEKLFCQWGATRNFRVMTFNDLFVVLTNFSASIRIQVYVYFLVNWGLVFPNKFCMYPNAWPVFITFSSISNFWHAGCTSWSHQTSWL